MADVFDLKAKLSLDSKDYKQGLNEAKSAGSDFGGEAVAMFSAVAMAVVAVVATVAKVADAFGEAIQEVADYGDSVDKNSQRLGLSTEAYQKWDYALNLAGTSMSECSTGMKTLTNQIDKAKGGSKEAIANFNKLGISMEDLNDMSREDIFTAVVMGMQNMADSTDRASLANDLFGKSGQNLTPIFNMTNKELLECFDTAEKYGMVMGEESVEASAKFVDSQTTLDKTLKGIKNNILSNFLPALTKMNDGLTDIFSGVDLEGGKKKLKEGIKEFVEVIKDIAPDVIRAVLEVVQAIIEALSESMEEIEPVIVETVYLITEVLNNNMDVIVECAIVLGKAFVETLLKMIGTYLQAKGEDTLDGFADFGESLGFGMSGSIAEALKENDLATVMLGLLKQLQATGAVMSGNVGFFIGRALIKNLTDKLGEQDLGSVVKEKLASVKDSIGEVVSSMAGSVGQGFSSMANNAKTGLSQMGTAVSSVFQSIGNAVSSGVSGAVSGISSFASSVAMKFGEAKTHVANFVGNLGSSLGSSVTGIISSIISAFNGFTSAVSSAMNGAQGAFGSFTGALSNLVSGVGSVIQSIIAEFQNLVNEVANFGANVAQGFLQGFQSAWSAVESAVAKGVNAIKQAIQNLLNIHSPSRWAKQMGEFTGEGFNIGFSASFGDTQPVEDFIKTMEDYASVSFGLGDMSANIAPQQVNVSNFSEQENRVTVVLEGDASRLFRVMQTQTKRNAQLVGV